MKFSIALLAGLLVTSGVTKGLKIDTTSCKIEKKVEVDTFSCPSTCESADLEWRFS